MTLNTAWDALVNGASGLVLVAAGAWLLSRRDAGRGAAALGGFALAFGVVQVLVNLLLLPSPGSAYFRAWTGAILVSTIVTAYLLLRVVLTLPGPMPRVPAWRGLPLAAVIGVLFALERAFAQLDAFAGRAAVAEAFDEGLRGASLFTYAGVMRAAFIVALILIVVRHHETRRSPGRLDERRQLRLMFVGLALYPAVDVGYDLLTESQFRFSLARGIVLLGLVAYWIHDTRTPDAPGEAAASRNAALVVLGLALLTMVERSLNEHAHTPGADGPMWGISRLLGVLVLMHAILRHRLLGADVTARLAISRSTLAATFIAVFFVVSEAAQEFFGGVANSQYLGIAAAGGLLFVLAPLQRAADRLAAKAVPVVHAIDHDGSQAAAPRDRDDTYRDAVRYALADRTVTRAEERHLASLAEHLGIGAGRARVLREEVEDALAAGPDRRKDAPEVRGVGEEAA